MVELLFGETYKGESRKAIAACNDWLRLGAGRSLPFLLEQYSKAIQSEPNGEQPPTLSLSTIKKWSADYSWSKRAELYDADINLQKEQERQRVFSEGLALDYERVRRLLRLAEFLEGQVYETDDNGNYTNVWLPDVKSVGSGENAERVDIVRFNANVIQQFRETLDDIAQEVGGRKRNVEVGTKDGKALPIKLVEVVLDAAVADDELNSKSKHG